MKKPTASISRIVFSGGQSIDFEPNDKIVLVGPNNSGKSLCLREVHEIASLGNRTHTLAIHNMEIKKSGTQDDLKKFLDNEATWSEEIYHYKDWQLHQNKIPAWERPYITKGLAPGFIKSIAAADRLAICAIQPSISPTEQKSKPQHVLYDDSKLMDKISGLFRRAFGEDIMFDFRGGSRLPIHVGSLPDFGGVVDRVGDTYVEAVRANSLLHEQGDGMKSYAGILFEAIVAARDIILIDEPEAFLHPPQMRQLGQTLAAEVGGQLLSATHSADIMRGFLEGTKGQLRVLRICRKGNKNIVREAAPEVIRELWEDPQFRYSNALEGIFHEQTIFCEDDSDCRLMNSVADYIAAERGQPWKDTAYVPTGGKHGIPDVAAVLRQIGVPVKAVFDIDFLSEEHLVKKAVEAFGGNWDEVRPYWARVDAAVREGVQSKTIPEIKRSIIALLNETEEESLPRSDVIQTMKQNKPWKTVKRYGVDGIPKGQAQSDYGTLKDKLEGVGIYLVPVGEIENFCREIGTHGSEFVTKLLLEKGIGDPDLYELRAFVERIHTGQHSR